MDLETKVMYLQTKVNYKDIRVWFLKIACEHAQINCGSIGKMRLSLFKPMYEAIAWLEMSQVPSLPYD